jgi:ATP-binding cassette subfamily B protein
MKHNGIAASALKSTIKNKLVQSIFLATAILGGIAMQLVPPQILKSIIDNNISKGIYSGVMKLSLYYLLAVVLSGAFDFLRELMMAIIGQDILANIRYNMGKKLKKLPIAYYSNNAVGEIISRFTSDVDAVGTLFSEGLVGMLADGLKALGIIVSVYLISPVLALYLLIFIPVIYFITSCFKSATFNAQMAARKAVAHINGSIQELFNGIRTIKIFSKEQLFLNNFQQPLNENIAAVHKTSTLDSLFPCIMQILRAVIITLTVIIAAPKGLGSLGITIGSVAAVVDLISRMFDPIQSIAEEFQTIQEAIAGVSRINDFDNEKEEIRQTDKGDKYYTELSLDKNNFNNVYISVNNMSFSYDNKKNIVQDINFNVLPGTKVALVGRTGAGKSTILNLVAGLYNPCRGSIKIQGMNPFKIPENLRRKILGIVPQSFPIYDGTIRDAVTLYDETITDEQVTKACKTVYLHDDIMKLKNGYSTLIGEGESSLSHGQYQLLALACAIVCNPPILLLDEVTSGLDSLTEQKIFKALNEISKERTILTISHRVSGIIDADQVIILDNGRIVETGKPADLAGRNGWYAKYNQIEQLGWKL